MGRLFYSLSEGKTEKDIDVAELDLMLHNVKTTVQKYYLTAINAYHQYYNIMYEGIVNENKSHFGNCMREDLNEDYSSFYHPSAEITLNNTDKILMALRENQIAKFRKKNNSHYKRAIPRHKAEAERDLVGLNTVIQSLNAEVFGHTVKNEGGKNEKLFGLKNYYQDVTKDRHIGIFQDVYEASIKLVLFVENMQAYLKVIKICEDELAKYTKFNAVKMPLKKLQEKKTLILHKKHLEKLMPEDFQKREEYKFL